MREWVCNNTIPGLEADLWLERRLIDSTNHLERNIWAIEQTSVECGSTLIANCHVVACRVWINVNTDTTVQHTSERSACVVNIEVVAVKSRSVVENTSHLQSGCDIRRADQDVTLTTTCCLSNLVSFAFNLEHQALELLNRPTTVSVDVEVEAASSCCALRSTLESCNVNCTNNFTVDFSKNFCCQNVGQFCLSVKTVNCLQVLCEFHRILSLQSTCTSSNGNLLDRECHFWERDRAITHTFTSSRISSCGEVIDVCLSQVSSTGRGVTRNCTDVLVTEDGICVRLVCRICGISFVIECFVTTLCAIASAHCEDQACWACHWLHTANVISDEVRHCTTNQAN